MITKVFSVYDTKAIAYGTPFFMPSVGAAVRAFGDLANDPNTMVNRHPSDYVLFEIGSFDDVTSEMIWKSPGGGLGFASDYIVAKPIQYRPAAMDSVKMAIENPLATVEELSNGK